MVMEQRMLASISRWVYERRTHYLYRIDLEQRCLLSPPNAPAYDIIHCDGGNVAALQQTIRNFPSYLAARVQRGDQALFAVRDGEWIGRIAVVLGPQTYHVLGCAVPLAATEAYAHGLESMHEWRGKGVASTLLSHLFTTLGAQEITTVYAAIEVTNIPSRRLFEKFHCPCIGEVRSRRLCGRWHAEIFTHADGESPLPPVSTSIPLH